MNFSILIGLIIVLAGIYFRILPYDNVQGLWNDEYMSWFIAQKPFFTEFFKGVLSQCHMPFYYLYLKFITKIFGNSDVILRLSSFIIGIASIFVMFKVGNLYNKKNGFLCAFFTAISGFLIYFSYEVRPYIFIFLFSALSLYYSIKLLDTPEKKNFLGYIISNLLIIFTHTIGFVYVFFNLLFVGHFLNKSDKKSTKLSFIIVGIGFLTMLPLIFKIFSTVSFSQWWSNFSLSKIGFMLTDFFSNYLTNIITAPQSFINSINWSFLIVAIIPTTIAIIGLINAFFKENFYAKSLLLVAFTTSLVIFCTSLTGKIIFLSKYNIEIYPILIYLSMLGLSSIKNKFLSIGLITILFFTNTTYLFSANFKYKFNKTESHKLVANLLNNAHLKEGDMILFTYYPKDRFEKYYDFSKYKVVEIHKGNFNFFMSENVPYKTAVKNAHTLYKPIYATTKNENFDKYFKLQVFDNLESGQKLAIVFLNSVSMFSDIQTYLISSNEKTYKTIPQMFLIFSYIKNRVIKLSTKNLIFRRYENEGDFSVAIFEKP